MRTTAEVIDCVNCGGKGIFGTLDMAQYTTCSACEGCGKQVILPPELHVFTYNLALLPVSTAWNLVKKLCDQRQAQQSVRLAKVLVNDARHCNGMKEAIEALTVLAPYLKEHDIRWETPV